MTKKDKRKYHLAYCKLCERSYIDYKKGMVCSLTDAEANFENECTSLQVDFDKLEDKEVEIHNQILNFIRRRYLLKSLTKSDYKLPSHKIKSKYHTIEKTHGLEFKAEPKSNPLNIVGVIALFASFYLLWNSENKNLTVLYLFLTFASVCFCIARFIIEHYTPIQMKTVLKTDALGFVIFEKRIFWNDIVDFRLLKSHMDNRDGGNFYYLILGTISGGVEEFSLRDIKVNSDEIIEIINLNKKEYFTQYERMFPSIN